jgi:hypothetical protein
VQGETQELHDTATLGGLAFDGAELLALLHVAAPNARLELLRVGQGLKGALALKASPARRPTLRAERGQLDVAYVDESGDLVLLGFEDGRAGALRVLDRKLDRRFSPALLRVASHLLVAYTKTVDTAMHTFVARVSKDQVALRDVTPQGHGAAAPSFVRGHEAPLLVAIDARAGISPLLEVGFDARLVPRPAVVRTPVSQPYAPPYLEALSIPGDEIAVAYTALGRLAATAIGRVPLRTPTAPTALLPSLGYGELIFSGDLGQRAAVFAMEAPISAQPNARRALSLKVVDARGEGPELRIEDATQSLRAPSLVALAEPGRFALLYFVDKGARLAWLRCDA